MYVITLTIGRTTHVFPHYHETRTEARMAASQHALTNYCTGCRDTPPRPWLCALHKPRVQWINGVLTLNVGDVAVTYALHELTKAENNP